MAAKFIDFDTSLLTFVLDDCKRVWPSGVTLLCSLKEWVELATRSKKRTPSIMSTPPRRADVQSYLSVCGFYDYVGRETESLDVPFDESKMVKIIREQDNIEAREDQLINLLERYSSLNSEEIDKFNCIVLTEIFNNVTEHGISSARDKGYWIIAQYHEQNKIISICIADNGLGVRHNLMTGPQATVIAKKLKNTHANDGEFIKMAIEENVSGAMEASLKTDGVIIKKYPSGARRGNGLNRIKVTCQELRISLSILSHHGYIFLDEKGSVFKCGAKQSRVFAGTMYHLCLPIVKET